jgi:mono/diheme cytochrome c family protein
MKSINIVIEDEMKLGTLKKSAVLALFCFSTLFACAQSDAASAHALFKARCALCHGDDGKGATTLGKQMKASNLNSSKVQLQKNAALKQVITNGKGNMPPFGAVLSDEQINQLLKYVRTFGKSH